LNAVHYLRMPRPRIHALYSPPLSSRGRLCHKARHKTARRLGVGGGDVWCVVDSPSPSRRVLGQFSATAGHSAWSPDATTTQLAAGHGRGEIAVQDWTGTELRETEGAAVSPYSRGALPGKGSPYPHSTRIAEGLGRGRPPLQKKRRR
jgi:hypothetical protein